MLGYLSTIHQQAYLADRFSAEAQRVCTLVAKSTVLGFPYYFKILSIGDALRRTPEQRRLDTEATTVGLRRKRVALR